MDREIGVDTKGVIGGPTIDVARGRPRDAGRDVAIHHATVALLAAVGYERLSIEAIAERAGVGKTTVYRRYANKAAVVLAALTQRTPSAAAPEVGSEDLRDGLLHTVTWLTGQIAEQEIGLLGAVFAGMRSDPELADGMRAILHRDVAAMTAQSLGAAAGHGVRLTDQAARLFGDIVPAVIVHRLVMTGQPFTPEFLAHLVDDILLPLLRRDEGAPQP